MMKSISQKWVARDMDLQPGQRNPENEFLMYKRKREVVRGEAQPKLGSRVDVRFPINRVSGVADGALHEPRLNFQRDRGNIRRACRVLHKYTYPIVRYRTLNLLILQPYGVLQASSHNSGPVSV